jgi:aspartyl-tRNA(Asn)/glutamyl-tRNA(Gln) amidotransferase subunit A
MFFFEDIAHYHTQLLQNTTTCVAAVQYYVDQINANQHLNAFTQIYFEEAIAKAATLDQSRTQNTPLKKLHGVVIAIKDVICYKNHPVTAASKILKNYTSIYNATVIEKMLDEDAIIIGACNCDEFAMGSTNENSAYGRVLNAIDNSKVPGGSSGGSAVAVQAKMCMASLGSDTGGSVRQPADFCGVVGLKPTYGAVSRYGLIAYASSFDVIGVFANNIKDVNIVFNTIKGADAFDSTAILQDYDCTINDKNKKYRIAYLDEAIHHESLDAEIKEKLLAHIDDLREAKHIVEAVPFNLLDYIVPTYYILTTAEASSNLNRYDGVRYGFKTEEPVADLDDFYKKTRTEGFGKEVQRRIMLGTFVLSAGYYDAYFSKAQKVRRMLVDKINEIFANYDAIILPVSPSTAFSFGEKTTDPTQMYLADIYTVFANLVGVPALSVPIFTHSNGMPFGIQIMANKMQETTLMTLGNQIMEMNTVEND